MVVFWRHAAVPHSGSRIGGVTERRFASAGLGGRILTAPAAHTPPPGSFGAWLAPPAPPDSLGVPCRQRWWNDAKARGARQPLGAPWPCTDCGGRGGEVGHLYLALRPVPLTDFHFCRTGQFYLALWLTQTLGDGGWRRPCRARSGNSEARFK
eukprot:gene19209-biopygen2483